MIDKLREGKAQSALLFADVLAKSYSQTPRRIYFSKPRKMVRSGGEGFILIAILLIIALITVLAVTSLLVARIELAASSYNQKTFLARLHALFALQTALGQLQREAGPDQRVTARADILSLTANPPNSGNQNWTGVWKTYNPSFAGSTVVVNNDQQLDIGNNLRAWATNSQNVAWLVSNPNATTPVTPSTWTSSSSNSVTLAYDQSVSPAAVVAQAPLVPITSTNLGGVKKQIGKYAYWVSDEGVKAKVNLIDPTLNSAPQNIDPTAQYTQNLLHFLTPQSTAGFKVLPETLSTDFRANTALAKITSLAGLTYIPPTESTPGSAPASYYPSHYSTDLTTYSFGVLADVRNGGLKRDLTAAFEDSSTSNSGQYNSNFPDNALIPNGTPDTQSVYRSTTAYPTLTAQTDGSAYLDGMRWRSLYFFYNIYKSIMPLTRASSSGTSPGGLTTAPGNFSQPYAINTRFYGWKDNGKVIGLDQITPLVLGYRVEFVLASTPVGPNYTLQLHAYGQIVLYNPYSFRLTFSPNFYIENSTDALLQTINITSNGAFVYNGALNGPYAGYARGPVIANGDVVSLDPGEVRVFAPDNDTLITASSASQASTLLMHISNLKSSNANVSADHSQYINIPPPVSGASGTPNGASWLSNGDQLIRVTCSSNIGGSVFSSNEGGINNWPDGVVSSLGSSAAPGATATQTWPVGGIMLSQMTGQGYRIIGYFVRAKGLQTDSNTNYVNYKYNEPLFMGNAQQMNIFNSVALGSWAEEYATGFASYPPSSAEIQMNYVADASGTNHWDTTWGNTPEGVSLTANPQRVVLKDLPSQPMVSLGQFMQMNLYYYDNAPSAPANGSGWGAYLGSSMCVGGSLANPSIPTTATSTTTAGNYANLDDSFMANQALFDSYFFSTVPSSTLSLATYYPQINSFNSKAFDPATYSFNPVSNPTGQPSPYIAVDKPLPNARMRYYRRNGLNPSVSDLQDTRKAAANLLLDGAFNINSTSVNAWVALLSSLSGNGLLVWNPNAQSGSSVTLTASQLLNPIPRFWTATNTSGVNQPWSGQVALTDSQIGTLASAIVKQIQTRGPFLSMADFLNRRLGASGPLSLEGALQAAIDSTTINSAVVTASGAPSVSLPNNPAVISGNTPYTTATGMPGYLMQQDIIQSFSPVMTARSDTFVIRCYGESDNLLTGTADATAYGEAVVQRLPDYLDPTDNPQNSLIMQSFDPNATQVTSAINQALGRRFKIVSFRWLNSNEL